MNGWMDGWMDGWMKSQNVPVYLKKMVLLCMCACVLCLLRLVKGARGAVRLLAKSVINVI